MYIAIVHARKQARSGAPAERTAALMEATHNIPLLLTRWEDFDEARLRADLARHDARWAPPESPRLLVAYEKALAGRSTEDR
jgi:hypothetical protein